MSNVKFDLNIAGFNELRKSPGIVSECRKYADRVCSAAGDGYKVERRTYPDRDGYAVFPDTPAAVNDNLRNNTLLKSLH